MTTETVGQGTDAGRDLPRVQFTDAEAGAKEFPSSGARAYEYYNPQKRKRSLYEDVTVEVQPDPRHYLSQGWLYSFADGSAGYPLEWTALKARGQDTNLPPERYRGSGGAGHVWPATGWHEFRDPNEEWELTFYRYNSNVERQINQQHRHRQARPRPSSNWNQQLDHASWSATSAPGCTWSTAWASTCSPTPSGGRPPTCTTTRSR